MNSKQKTKSIARVIGIDPGTGAKSGTGIAVFDPESKLILQTFCIKPDSHESLQSRIKTICRELESLVTIRYPPNDSLYCMEHFIMRGVSGETLKKLIGAIMLTLPDGAPFVEVHNMTLKKAMGGGISKEGVAAGVLNWFVADETVAALIEGKKWDITDALAIGIVGYEAFIKNQSN